MNVFLLIISCSLFLLTDSDVQLERDVNDLMRNLLEKWDVELSRKCLTAYTFCKKVGLVVGKTEGTEGEDCVQPDQCVDLWVSGKLLKLKDRIASGFGRMLVGLTPKQVLQIRKKVRRCC